MKPADAAGPKGGEAPQAVQNVLRSPGQPLDRTTQSFFESRFGQDFSEARVHADQDAAESAASLGALAYTAGSNNAFASGRHVWRTEIIGAWARDHGTFQPRLSETEAVLRPTLYATEPTFRETGPRSSAPTHIP
jgi:hypothetical protein